MPPRGKKTTQSDLPLSKSSSSHTDASPSHDERNKRKGGCCGCSGCCWLWMILLLGVAGAAAGLTWYLLPEDAKEDLPSLSMGRTESPTFSPPPTMAPTIPWQFDQCDDDTDACCQGLDVGTCELRVNEMLYGYVHNAVHTVEDDFLFPWNQQYGLEKALEAGYRALELDVGRCGDNEEVVFYHSRCALGTRDPVDVLSAIGQFLTQHPNDILILLLQMPDMDVVSLTQFDEIMQTVPTVANRMYAHTGPFTQWPTLQELIDIGQRVVVFFKSQPSCRDATQSCPSTAYHFWNEYAVETAWDFRSVEQIDDTVNSCAPNRGITSRRDFYRVNAFVTLPSQKASETLNKYEYAQARMAACASVQGQVASFYAVDFWHQGKVLQLVQDVNRQRAIVAAKERAAEQAKQQQQEEDEVQQDGGGQGGGERT